jgi:hypothetical protein
VLHLSSQRGFSSLCSFLLLTMVHDFVSYHSNLLLLPSYIACPGSLTGISWQCENTGHVVINKTTNSNMVILIVRRVVNLHLFASLNGNYSADTFGGFLKAKYHFLLGKPEKTLFEQDHTLVMERLEKIQSQIVNMPQCLNFLVTDGPNKNVHFMQNVFTARVSVVDDYWLCQAS